MKVLIVSMPDDFHAFSVKLALELRGHQCTLWYTSDFPGLQRHSFELSAGDFSWCAEGEALDIQNDQFDIVWYRRARFPIVPDCLHPEDEKNAFKEIMAFFQSLWPVIAPDATWVNDAFAARRADKKLYQLKVAQSLGFSIPETVIGNDPKKINHFLNQQKDNGVIYKAFCPLAWIGDTEARVVYTHLLKKDDLPYANVLQAVPGIYQKKIEKAYELRVTYMAGKILAIKINSQIDTRGKIDWRRLPAQDIAFEQIDPGLHITDFCCRFMTKLGLVFGCLDFIVTPTGEAVFLEVNEQGQFLWKEELDPNVLMLDAFVKFLESQGGHKTDAASTNSLRLKDFADTARALKTQALDDHLVPPMI